MITKDQQRALLKVWKRYHRRHANRRSIIFSRRDFDESYLAFRRRASYSRMISVVMIRPRMDSALWLGIEHDGYTHS